MKSPNRIIRGENMKARELLKELNQMGYKVIRSSKHIVLSNGSNTLTVPHQKEINPFLTKKILRDAMSNGYLNPAKTA